MLLNELMNVAEERFRRNIGTKDQAIPHWLLVNTQGDRALIATPWHSKSERDAVVDAIRGALKVFDCVAYSVSYEAWAAAEPKGDYDKEKFRPSQQPDKVEVVMVIACDGTKQKSKTWEIIRGPDEIIQDLKLLYESEGGEGVLSNLFQEEQDEQENVRNRPSS